MIFCGNSPGVRMIFSGGEPSSSMWLTMWPLPSHLPFQEQTLTISSPDHCHNVFITSKNRSVAESGHFGRSRFQDSAPVPVKMKIKKLWTLSLFVLTLIKSKYFAFRRIGRCRTGRFPWIIPVLPLTTDLIHRKCRTLFFNSWKSSCR